MVPDVIVFTDFDSVQWREQWSGGKRSTIHVVDEDKTRSFEPLSSKALRIKVGKDGH